MKKNILIILIIVVLLTTLFIVKTPNSVEKIIEKTLMELYSNEYSVLEKLNPEEVYLYDQERVNGLKDSFSDNLYNKNRVSLSILSNVALIKQLRCDTEIESLDLDIRKYDNDLVCYFTIKLELIFVDEAKDSIITELNGVSSIVAINDELLIDAIEINNRNLKLLIKNEK